MMGHNYLYVEVACYLATAVSNLMKLFVLGTLTWPTIMKLGLKITWPLITPAVVNANNYVGDSPQNCPQIGDVIFEN